MGERDMRDGEKEKKREQMEGREGKGVREREGGFYRGKRKRDTKEMLFHLETRVGFLRE